MNYYKATAIRGHLGAGNGDTIVFAIEAETMYDAMQIARRMPMVKHNHPQAIKSVELISQEEFDKLRCESAYHRRKR